MNGDSKKRARTLFALGGVMLPVLAATLLYVCCGKITSAETLFHTTFAKQGLGAIFSGNFPAIQL
ncbi:MAG: hypothetical protein IKZ33_00935, partial [Lentisphaeria bacterium]|nr:hypothetical protein [Lentisphaeria bacterium]